MGAVEIKVDFSDGTSKTYYAKDMLFGYDEVDFTKFGKHSLKITVKELDIFEMIEIEIKVYTFSSPVST